MKKLLGVVMILFVAGSSAAADYWHLEVGFKGVGVMPGGNYENTLGYGVMAAFGEPDSRFNTQFEAESWVSTYDVSGYEHRYSGFGAGIYEKFRFLNISPSLSSYIIGGLGGYFLDFKQEEELDNIVQLRSTHLSSLFTLAGGLGFDFRLSQHVIAFTEGRYVYFPNGADVDKPLSNGYLGLRYLF
jgi:opacity protein-like surface antigen